jgi:hypothetical protein
MKIKHAMTCLFSRKSGLKATNFFFDFLKILPDTALFPNFGGEKIFNTKGFVKKIKLIDGRILAHF